MTSTMAVESTETMLARFAARLEIEKTLASFMHGTDDRNPELWLSAFHDDAVMVVDEGKLVLTGHAEILRWAQGIWELPEVTHISGDFLIDFQDDEQATGLSRGFGVFKLEDGSYALAMARMTDLYTKKGGQWKLARRAVGIISEFSVGAGQWERWGPQANGAGVAAASPEPAVGTESA